MELGGLRNQPGWQFFPCGCSADEQCEGTGRFGNWLENLNDWNLSRSRFWGTPLPIWRNRETREELCIGSVVELYNEIEKKMKAAAVQNIDNELGYMLVVRFIDEQADAELLEELIAKMPEKYRQRRPIIKLQSVLNSRINTDEGQVMPDFTLLTPDSIQQSVLAEVRQHKFTVIDFWASWCNPCRAAMPSMKQLYTDFNEKGLGIVGISLDDKAEDWRQAISDLKMEWTQLSDLKGRDAAAARAFRISAIPYIVVVDSVGTILKKGLNGDDLRLFISDLLN